MKEALDDSSRTEAASAAARVLIVDDETSILALLSELLSIVGYSAAQASSPGEALELLRSEPFDVVLSDFHMPEMNGEAFYLSAVAENPDLKERFVFLTGDSAGDETQDFLERSGLPHLNKPFQLDAMQQVIEGILARSGQRSAAGA